MKENRGPPAGGWDPLAALRLPRGLVKQVDDWVKRNGGSRSAAIRGFIDKRVCRTRVGAMREMATTEELNIRVGILANEVEGEKAVTRYAFEQVRLNTDELTAFRADARLRLDRMSADMALLKAAQIAQGGTLNVLVQDVRELRQDTIALRRHMDARLDRVEARLDGVEARLDRVDARLDGVEARLDRVDARLDGVEARLDRVEARLDGVDARLDKIEARLDRLETRFDQMQEGITAILAAVSPRNPT